MLTLDQVIALAPDAASIKAGRGLASSRKWSSLGTSDGAIWGLAQGSGKKPYLTQVFLPEPAFKCSCPSRKFPCKHALGLLFIAAGDPSAITESSPPDWVAEWLASRAERADKQASKRKNTPDVKAATKRKDKKISRIDEGVSQLEQALKDIYSHGLAHLEHSQTAQWETLVKRMIDAQASGLAGQIRALSQLTNNPNWKTPFIHASGSLYLLLRAWKKRATLSPELRSEVEQLIGLTPNKEDVLKNPPVADDWFIASRKFSEIDRLSVCQTWLFGTNTGKWAKKLTFSPLPQKPHDPWPLGNLVKTSHAYYPGITQLRVLPTNENATTSPLTHPLVFSAEAKSFKQFLQDYSELRTKNPWHRYQPVLLSLTPHYCEGQHVLIDTDGSALPWKTGAVQEQLFTAISGNLPTLACAEWDGSQLTLLSAFSDRKWLDLPLTAPNISSQVYQSSLTPISSLGTGQTGSLPPAPEDVLAVAWNSIDSADLSAAVLEAAALENALVSTGVIPQEILAPEETEPSTPSVEVLSDVALDAALGMISGEKKECLSEWLHFASHSKKRAPHHFLPRLLDHGKLHPEHRQLIATITSTRGTWLAARYQEWQWLSEHNKDAALPDATIWETGDDPMRLSWIAQLNDQHPDQASQLISTSWKSESPAFKLSLISTIQPQPAHEVWLELAGRDARQEIRENATSSLLSFPSNYRQRAITRASSFVTISKRKLTLTLPDSFDPSWSDDGIKEKYKPQATLADSTLGVKAGWLHQILARVPLEHWNTLIGSNKQVWKAPCHPDWKELIRTSLHAAAQYTHQPETLLDYLLHISKTHSLQAITPILTLLCTLCERQNTSEPLNQLIGKIDDIQLLKLIANHPSSFFGAEKTTPFIFKKLTTLSTDSAYSLTRPQARQLALAVPTELIQSTLQKISKLKKLNTHTEEFAHQLEFRHSYIQSLTASN